MTITASYESYLHQARIALIENYTPLISVLNHLIASYLPIDESEKPFDGVMWSKYLRVDKEFCESPPMPEGLLDFLFKQKKNHMPHFVSCPPPVFVPFGMSFNLLDGIIKFTNNGNPVRMFASSLEVFNSAGKWIVCDKDVTCSYPKLSVFDMSVIAVVRFRLGHLYSDDTHTLVLSYVNEWNYENGAPINKRILELNFSKVNPSISCNLSLS